MRLIAWLAAVLTAFSVATAHAAPRAQLVDAYWTNHDPASAATLNHGAWGDFLARHVRPGPNGVNRLNYAVAKGDHSALKGYIAALSAVDPTQLNRAEQMAYWINLYNAATVDIVLDAYPVRSIKRVRGGIFNVGPWEHKILTVAGRRLSLNDIEHGILRPIWRDPRIHYAVNCASIGCPNLAAQPYTGATLAAMLDQAARDYVNHPRGASVSGSRLRVSSIYDWYAVDFGGSNAGVIAHLRQYAAPDLAAALAGVNRISGDDYDWSLNDLGW